jgi:peptidoglycan/LPS O-acetylase OafA/YrhL
MTRLILSILAAFVITAALSTAVDFVLQMAKIFPPYGEPFFDTWLVLLASAYRAVFQIFGAYVASMIAKDKAKKAVWTIGILGTLLWLGGTFLKPQAGPIWYGLLGAALSLPTTLTGGKLYELQTKKTSTMWNSLSSE